LSKDKAVLPKIHFQRPSLWERIAAAVRRWSETVIELLEEVVGPPVALEPLKNKPGQPRRLCAIGLRRTAIGSCASEAAPEVPAA
jgi:hypothetical protein